MTKSDRVLSLIVCTHTHTQHDTEYWPSPRTSNAGPPSGGGLMMSNTSAVFFVSIRWNMRQTAGSSRLESVEACDDMSSNRLAEGDGSLKYSLMAGRSSGVFRSMACRREDRCRAKNESYARATELGAVFGTSVAELRATLGGELWFRFPETNSDPGTAAGIFPSELLIKTRLSV